MPTPLKWNRKTLLFAIEATYGTDENPDAATDAILAQNVQLSPMEGQDESRELELTTLGAQPTIPTGIHAKLSFDVELAGSGAAGTPPAYGPLLRGCAVAETIVAATSVTYNPVSDAHESGTFYLWIEGTLYALVGSRGTATIRIEAQKVPKISFTFTGLFVLPTAVVQASPTLTSWQKPVVATSVNTPVFTIGGTSLVLRSCEFDLGNEVVGRFLIGAENILITAKAEKIACTIEAVPLATLDPYQLALAQNTQPLILQHGTVAGHKVGLNVPLAQMQRPAGLNQQQGIVEWPLSLVPQVNAGNDQWTLTLT